MTAEKQIKPTWPKHHHTY